MIIVHYRLFSVFLSILIEGEVKDDLQRGQLKENSPFLLRGLNLLPHDLQTQLYSFNLCTTFFEEYPKKMHI